jgi:hypothetical protein
MIARRSSGLVLALILLAACAGSSTPAPTSAPTGAANPTVASTLPASPVTGGGANGGPVAAGADLCGLLGPGDFAAAGVSGAGKPTENNQDPSNVYCVYAGKSAGTGGIEFDAFLAGSAADSKASYDAVAAPMLDFAGEGKAAFPDADGAVVRNDIPGPYAGIAIWKGKLVFDIGIPTTATSKVELIALAKLVLQRAAGLT